jgi:hypothetical protein
MPTELYLRRRFKIAASYYDQQLLEWLPGMFTKTGEDERGKALSPGEKMGANYKEAARIDICVRKLK